MTDDELAARLDLDVDDIGICLACLSFVSFAIDSGDTREIARATKKIAPDLWAEGLEQPVRMALKRAGAREALAEVGEAAPTAVSCARSCGASRRISRSGPTATS